MGGGDISIFIGVIFDFVVVWGVAFFLVGLLIQLAPQKSLKEEARIPLAGVIAFFASIAAYYELWTPWLYSFATLTTAFMFGGVGIVVAILFLATLLFPFFDWDTGRRTSESLGCFTLALVAIVTTVTDSVTAMGFWLSLLVSAAIAFVYIIAAQAVSHEIRRFFRRRR